MADAMADTMLVTMTPAHVDLLLPFEKSMFGPEAWSRAAYLDELSDGHHRYYVAAEDHEHALLGWAGVMIVGDVADILTVGVVPKARRRGVGRQLLAALLTEARRRHVRECFLEVRVDNVPAIELYESEGFRLIGKRPGYYDGGRGDALVMRREL